MAAKRIEEALVRPRCQKYRGDPDQPVKSVLATHEEHEGGTRKGAWAVPAWKVFCMTKSHKIAEQFSLEPL